MKRKLNLPLFGSTLAVNLLSMTAGGAFSWTSPVLPKLNGNVDPEDNPLGSPITPLEESWVASLVGLGATFGPIAGGAAVDKFGRKKTLIGVAVPMVVAYLILAFADAIEYYYGARFLLGLGAGCVYQLVPMYVGEIAEDSNRGALGCIMYMMCTTGTLFCYCVGPFVTIQKFSLACLAPLLAFLLVFGCIGPESPHYFVAIGEKGKAKLALSRLRTSPVEELQVELDKIAKHVIESKSTQAKPTDLFKSKATIKALAIGLGLMLFLQFSGITVLTSYMQSIFDAAGSTIPAHISSIIVASVQLLANFVTSQLVDKLGRKALLVSSLIGCVLAHAALGAYFHVKTLGDVTALFWLPVASLMVYIVSFNLGIGPISWVVLGELFPPNYKSVAMVVTSVFSQFLAFILTVFFPTLIAVMGMDWSFWMFACSCGLGAIFVVASMPETKGRSLQEIQAVLGERAK